MGYSTISDYYWGSLDPTTSVCILDPSLPSQLPMCGDRLLVADRRCKGALTVAASHRHEGDLPSGGWHGTHATLPKWQPASTAHQGVTHSYFIADVCNCLVTLLTMQHTLLHPPPHPSSCPHHTPHQHTPDNIGGYWAGWEVERTAQTRWWTVT